jgi:hypothetical protein
MAQNREHDSGTMLLVGFVVGTLTISVVVYVLIKALRAGLDSLGGHVGAGGQPINIYNNIGGQQTPAIQPSMLGNAMQLGNGTSLATRADTMTLSTSRASRVFQAPNKSPMWLVRVHVLGPAGSFASFAIDGTPSSDGSGSIVVPAGGHTELRMGARQTLSGIASGAAAQISYSASAEVV